MAKSYQEILDELTDYYGDPTKTPEFYPERTYVPFGEDELRAQESRREAADISAGLATDASGVVRDILAGEDEYTQRLAKEAAGAEYGRYAFGGTGGGARGQYASQRAAADVAQEGRLSAIDKIANINRYLTEPAEILDVVGQDIRQLEETKLEEDIARHQYAQYTPEERLKQQAGAAALREAIKAGRVSADVTKGGGDFFGDALGKVRKLSDTVGSATDLLKSFGVL